jgi:hypothetical protein
MQEFHRNHIGMSKQFHRKNTGFRNFPRTLLYIWLGHPTQWYNQCKSHQVSWFHTSICTSQNSEGAVGHHGCTHCTSVFHPIQRRPYCINSVVLSLSKLMTHQCSSLILLLLDGRTNGESELEVEELNIGNGKINMELFECLII